MHQIKRVFIVHFHPSRLKQIEKELQMMKPGLKLVKDEEVKPAAKSDPPSHKEEEEPTPTRIQAALPYGHVASWLWDFFKKGDKSKPVKKSNLGEHYTKI